jgi:hypothetical protein
MSLAESPGLDAMRFPRRPGDVGAVPEARRWSAGRAGARSRAPDALRLAFLRVRDDLKSSGWVLVAEPVAQAADHLIVRFAIHRDDVVVSTCGFAIGPERTVVFGRPAEPAVTGSLDAMGEAEFRQLIGTWVREVQAGIGHRWRYEAKARGRG